ncbi:MAG: AraC family transcriptional regulator [Acidobacteriota bacterium]
MALTGIPARQNFLRRPQYVEGVEGLALKVVEKVLFRSESVAVCRFECPAEHPLFPDSGPSNANTFVFPRTSVRVHREDGKTMIGGPQSVSFFNRGEGYRRSSIGGAGSRCDWFVVDSALLSETVARFDPEAARTTSGRPFRARSAPVDNQTLTLERALIRGIVAEPGPDAAAVEETVLELLARLLRAAHATMPLAANPRASRREAEIADATKAWIAAHFRLECSLAEIARALGVSVFHLAHAFRRQCGTSIHRYRDQVRVRTALDALDAGWGDLTTLAMELGYSSHSHFTERFRLAFGVTPSAYRAGGGGNRAYS